MSFNKKVAKKRINYLFDLASKHEVSDFSNNCVRLARKISLKYKVPFSYSQKISFCKKCLSFLVLGKNLKVRVSKSKIVYTCKCSNIKRFSYK